MTRSPMNRRSALQALLGTACSSLVPTALAQAGRPIRFILPVATDSGSDIIARAAQHGLARVLGHTVIIDNQPGPGGRVGTAALVKSAPDGYTLGFVSNNHVIYPSVYGSVPFDPINDITPIAMVGATPMVVVCNPKVPAANAKEMVALLKSRAGQVNFGSSGSGTLLHLASRMFLEQAGAKANHVPYQGAGPMIAALIGGQIEFATAELPSVQAHLKSGALRALGVGSAERVAAAPEIPTMAEQGLPGFLVEGWFAFIAPKGLAPMEVKHLNAAAQSAFALPVVKDAMARQGSITRLSTPEVAAEFIRTEMVKYAQLVKKAGIELQ